MIIVACDKCGWTGTTHPGEHPHEIESECFNCADGVMVEYVQLRMADVDGPICSRATCIAEGDCGCRDGGKP